MAKQEKIEFKGKVTELLPNAMFRVKLENNHEVLAHTAGKLRKNRISLSRWSSLSGKLPTIWLKAGLLLDFRIFGLVAQ